MRGVAGHLRRYLEIIWCVLRLRATLRWQRIRAWLHKHLHLGKPVHVDRGAALRHMIETLGGSFIKFGQIMAMRPDLLPPEMIETLSGLLDRAPQFPPEEAMRVIEVELGAPVHTIFRHFSATPLAAASFAQVHRATLTTGEEVVVKVQRPRLRPQIEADTRFILALAWLVDLLGVLGQIRLRPIVQDFVSWTFDELDYIREATFAERMRLNAAGNKYEHIPRVFWDYITPRVLVQEYLDGVWISELLDAINKDDQPRLAAYRARGIDLKQVAYNIFHAGLHQAFQEDVFHADPHAGNIAVLEGNIPGYIDFGIIGELSEGFRATQVLLLQYLQQGQVDQFVRTLFRMFYPPPVTTNIEDLEERLRKNVRDWINNCYNPRASLHERSSAYLLTRNFTAAREFGLSYNLVSIRYYRALLVAELIVLQLDPEFDTRANIRQFFIRYGLTRILEDRQPVALTTRLMDLRMLAVSLPDAARELLNLAHREAASIRTSVSFVLITAARLCKFVSYAGALMLLAAIGFAAFAPDLFSRFFWFSLPVYLGILVPAAPLLYLAGKLLERNSVRRGSYQQMARTP